MSEEGGGGTPEAAGKRGALDDLRDAVDSALDSAGIAKDDPTRVKVAEAMNAAAKEAKATSVKYARLESAFLAQVELAKKTRDEIGDVARHAAEEAARRVDEADARTKRREAKLAQTEQRLAATVARAEKARERAEAAESAQRDSALELARVRESSQQYVAAITAAVLDQSRKYDDCTAVLAACTALLKPPSGAPNSPSPVEPVSMSSQSPCTSQPEADAAKQQSATDTEVNQEAEQQTQQQQQPTALGIVCDAERKLMALMEETTSVYARAKSVRVELRRAAEDAAAVRREVMPLLEEVKQLRARYFMALGISVKQNLLSSASQRRQSNLTQQQREAETHWRDLQELLDQALEEGVNVSEWPSWITKHIEVTNQ